MILPTLSAHLSPSRSLTYKLLDDSLDELGKVESLGRLTVPNISTQHRHDFCICVRVKRVSPLVQDVLQLLVVGDDTVVYQSKL